ncbi:hypothetical protein VXR60_18235, partial [Acinetobacter baumannii]
NKYFFLYKTKHQSYVTLANFLIKDPAHAGIFFVTHHASKDDNPQTFARYGFYRFFYHIETVSKKWIKTNITSCF